MIVYADVLIVLNFVVDYFLLLATDKFLHKKGKLLRLISGAFFGAFTSLYIFLPQVNKYIELLTKIIFCFITVAIAFEITGVKNFLRTSGVYFLITSLYGGVMIAVWHILKPNGMVINNSVVYFDISPLILVTATVFFYISFTLCYKIFARNIEATDLCEITVFADSKNTNLIALIDTGNAIEDVFGKSEIIIADKSVFTSLFGENSFENSTLNSRFHLIPFKTVSGNDILKGFRCDRAEVKYKGCVTTIEKPIIAASKSPLKDGFNAIVNPKILN